VKLKRKTNLAKGPKKIKRMKIKIYIKNKNRFEWRAKLKRIITFIKGPRKKLEIKKIKTKSENIFFGKLRLKDEIENK
jgi:predicted metal-dependent peptidase